MIKRNFKTRDLRAFSNRSTNPILPTFSAGALDYPRVPSPFEGQSGFRCNRYISIFHKLYREFHATLPNAEKQGFIDGFHRKAGGVGFSEVHWTGRRTVSRFSLSYDHGHTYLSIGGRTILRIEKGVTRYLSDDNEVVEIPYSGEEVPSPVLRRFRAFLDVAQNLECIFKGMPEKPYVPDYSEVVWSHGSKPEFKPMTSNTSTVSVKILRGSKNRYYWNIRLRDRNNRNYHMDDYGTIPKAYLVEIQGVSAWLPHSLLGERYEALRHDTDTLEVPTWWLKKNI